MGSPNATTENFDEDSSDLEEPQMDEDESEGRSCLCDSVQAD